MPIRFELHSVQHPFKLCLMCDQLGWTCVTLEPGRPNQREFFVCNEHLGQSLKDMGDRIIQKIVEEKGYDL